MCLLYFRIDESLCSLGKLSALEMTPALERRDTIGTIDGSYCSLCYMHIDILLWLYSYIVLLFPPPPPPPPTHTKLQSQSAPTPTNRVSPR